MRALRMALAGVMVAALVTGAVIYWAGVGPGLAGPSGPSGPADPGRGEFFIYGEILAIDRAGRVLTIDQHMEPGSVDVGGSVRVADGAEVIANMGDGREEQSSFDDLSAGHVVGMIVQADDTVRLIIYDQLESGGSIKPSDPRRGEAFIYAEVLAVDLARGVITIDQHMDSGSIDVGGSVTVATDVEVRGLEGGHPVIPMALDQLRPGHIVGMILAADGTVRAILVDGESPGIKPSDPLRGEAFIYAEVLAVDLARGVITIDQHMEPGSVDVGGSVTVAADVEVRGLEDGNPAIPMALDQLRPGHIVGMILAADGTVRAILVEDESPGIRPSDPRRGEAFIYAEVLAVDLSSLVITLDQHMEPGSVDVGGSVTVAADVEVRGLVDGYPVILMALDELRPGHIVGMILRSDGLVRAIIVD